MTKKLDPEVKSERAFRQWQKRERKKIMKRIGGPASKLGGEGNYVFRRDQGCLGLTK